MKYVMFAFESLDGRSVTNVPVIFPEMLSHKAMAEAIEFAWFEQTRAARFRRGSMEDRRRARTSPPQPVSAGFLDVNCTVDMHRESESLKMRPHEQDQTRINTWRYSWGQF